MEIAKLYEKFVECNYSVITDTRKNLTNALFFCLKGDNFDGNTFAHQAAEKGAKYVVIDNPEFENEKTILVENSLETLQKLANFHRKKLQTPIIAITGTNGKTTTKELVFSVLKQSFETICTQGNLNNHIGVPLTLLSIKPSTQIAIVEMGASAGGEIAFLCQIAQPDFGYITNFGKAHLEGFLSEQGVINAKMELYEYLIRNEKLIFFNDENAIQKERLANYSKKKNFSFLNEKADVFLTLLDEVTKAGVCWNNTEIRSQLVGHYNADNIAAAILIGLNFKVSEEKIRKGISEYVPSNSRSQIVETANNSILLDAYNANPSSMKVALENFEKIEHSQKIIILGEMKELGKDSQEEHQKLISLLEKMKNVSVYLVGEMFLNQKFFLSFSSTEKAFSFFEKKKIQNAFILIKGSRVMKLEELLPCF